MRIGVVQAVDEVVFGETLPAVENRFTVLHRVYPYIEEQLALGTPLTRMVRHLFGLFNGLPNARRWRRYLSENAYRKSAGLEILQQAERLVADHP